MSKTPPLMLDDVCRLLPGLTRSRSLSAALLRRLCDRKTKECTWCGTLVTGRRSTWCSDACVKEFQLRCDPGSQRTYVYKRDKHICQMCGLDIAAAATGYWQRVKELRAELGVVPPETVAALRWEYGYGRGAHSEVDHILAVEDGGGLLGPDNLRLVCGRCHSERTKEQAKTRKGRRSRKRR